jgi:adenylylsulfate kinase-like enzyme
MNKQSAEPLKRNFAVVTADLTRRERRDPKGLYRRARAGEIFDFTGVSAPYDEPEAPDLVVDIAASGVDACARHIVDYIQRALDGRKEPRQ